MVRIITDSTSDITVKHGKEMDIEILPLSMLFGDESYKDGITIKPAEFYKKLATSPQMPTTAQVTVAEMEGAFRPHIEAGDEIVGIFISAELSGTYQSSVIARENIGSENIWLVDSRNASLPLGMLVRIAVKLRDEGKGAAEIAEKITELSGKVRLLAALDTLKYLRKGGRLSTTSAILGGLLGILPIITISEGKVIAIGKARGKKAAMEFIQKEMAKVPRDESYPIEFAHSNSMVNLKEFMGYMRNYVDIKGAYYTNIGCIVGTHIGPGAVAIAYVAQ